MTVPHKSRKTGLDCTGCLAPCCRELALVEVEPSDLSEYMQVYPTVPDPEVYILKHREDGACIHLIDDNRCGIYDMRPRACREFDCRGDERINPRNRGPDWVGYK